MTEILSISSQVLKKNILSSSNVLFDDEIYSKYLIYKIYYINNLFNIVKNLKDIDKKYLEFIKPSLISFEDFKKNILFFNNFMILNKFQFVYNYFDFHFHVNKHHTNSTINYAVKCLPDDVFLNTLAKCNGHYDCASIGEIQKVLDNGGSVDNIIFANPMKTRKAIQIAQNIGIKLTTFDTVEEFLKLYEFGKDIDLVLRISVNSYAKINLSTKFGMEDDELDNLLYSNHPHLKKIKGIAFHVGSDNNKSLGWLLAIKKALAIVKRFKKIGINIEILDLGGGFPEVGYSNIIDSIFEVYGYKLSKFRLIFEPGRALCSTCVSYVPTISVNENKAFIDNEILHSYFKDCVIADRVFPYLNMSCDFNNLYDTNNDIIKTNRISKNKIIDIKNQNMIFFNFGAYTVSLASSNVYCYKMYL